MITVIWEEKKTPNDWTKDINEKRIATTGAELHFYP